MVEPPTTTLQPLSSASEGGIVRLIHIQESIQCSRLKDRRVAISILRGEQRLIIHLSLAEAEHFAAEVAKVAAR